MSTDVDAYEQWCPDGIVYTRVSAYGPTLGVQIEPAASQLTGEQLAQRLMAVNDVAYLAGRVAIREQFERYPGQRSVDGLETRSELSAAVERLDRLRLRDRP